MTKPNTDIKETLNGVNVTPFTSFDDVIDYATDHGGILVAVNAEKVLHATDQTRGIINRNIGYADGALVRMVLRRRGHADAVRLPGCELWLKLVERHHADKRFYLIGGRQEVIDDTVAKLRSEFSDINIVAYRNGYLRSPEERQQLIDDVVAKSPDVVFVAMGSPTQELLMEEMIQRHHAVYQGLGGSFDVYTGRVRRAPKWWCDHNLEFAYRLLREPRRIKRQIHLVKGLWWILIGKL